MASKIFNTGTVIDSNWLNDVNEAVYNVLPTKVSSISPVLITPNIGTATATSVNRITFTQPATGATLTIPNGATATVSGVNTGDQNLSTYPQFGTNNNFTGTNTFTGIVTSSINLNVLYSTASALTGSGAVTLNTTAASTYTLTVTGNTTISFTGAPPASRDQTIYIKLVNGGAFTTTFASGTKFPGGVTPTFTSAGKDLLSAWYDPFDGVWVVGMVWKDYK